VKDTLDIVSTLKRALRERGMTYRELARVLGMSEAGVKRAFAKRTFTLARLEEICGALGTSFFDLVRASARVPDARLHLTREQEALLAHDDKLFCFFSLLLAGLSPTRITARFRFTDAEVARAVTSLERLDLVRTGPRGRVTPQKAQDFLWATGGPLAQRHWPGLAQEFVAGDFRRDARSHFAFSAGALSPSSLAVLKKKVDALVAEFERMVATDAASEGERHVRIWFMNAYRPWTYSVVERYRRKP